MGSPPHRDESKEKGGGAASRFGQSHVGHAVSN